MATSAVELCNQALSAVPARKIVSLNDNTRSAIECRTHFQQALDEVIESGAYTFQTKRVRLTQREGSIKGFTRAFQVPADMAFPIRLSLTDEVLSHCDPLLFDWEGDSLYSREPVVWLTYISSTPQWSAMTAMFKKAVIDTLTSRLAVPLAGNERREQAKLQTAEVFRDRAIATNLNSNPTQNTYGNYMPDCLKVIGGGF